MFFFSVLQGKPKGKSAIRSIRYCVGHFIFGWIHQEIEVNLVKLQLKLGKVYKYIYLYFTFFPKWKKNN